MDIPGLNKIPNLNELLKNLEEQIDFPAEKDDIVSAVNRVPGIPDQAKQLLRDRLPDESYDSMDDVKRALGL